ncbi:alpha/beta fold hydrolase [Streptosporangium sp. NPDC048865]|uniref:thioesterase II family protein n=1 Tax=Streptosporangium sp. NPDC048865 TaxID=3155766 RepID=UPI0034185E61
MTATGTRAGAPKSWGVTWRPVPDATMRIFCLPHTGAGAAAYRAWAAYLPPEIELVAVRLPGRETRFRERPFTRIGDLVPALLDGLCPFLDRPHAWFGHSLGALVAYEACRALRDRGMPLPERLFVSGRRAPHLPDRDRPVHDAPVADMVARLEELNGTPREVLDDRATLTSLLPMLRADFAVAETYRWRPAGPLQCPISVFGGTRDPMATMAELRAWDRHSAGGCTVRMFDGDHFFLHESRGPVTAAITDDLRTGSGRPR